MPQAKKIDFSDLGARPVIDFSDLGAQPVGAQRKTPSDIEALKAQQAANPDVIRQAAKYPSSQERGLGGAGVEPNLSFFTRLKANAAEGLQPLAHPIDTLMDAERARAEEREKLLGAGTLRELADIPVPDDPLVSMVKDVYADPSAIAKYAAPALLTAGAVRSAPAVGQALKGGAKAGLNAATTPNALRLRAANLKRMATRSSPTRGGFADDALSLTVGGAIGGTPGAAAAEFANIVRQIPALRNARAGIYNRAANFMQPEIVRGSGLPFLQEQIAMIPQQQVAMRQTRPSAASQPLPDLSRMAAVEAERRAAMAAAPAPGLVAPLVSQAPQINRWMNVALKELNHGANPGLRIAQENLMASTQEAAAVASQGLTANGRILTATREKVRNALEDAGVKLGEKLSGADRKGVRIDAFTLVAERIEQAQKKWGSPKDATFKTQLDGLLQDAIDRFSNLDRLTPTETHAFKKWAGDSINWHASKADPINQLKVEIYRGLNASLKSAVPEISSMQSRWGDLYIADKGIGSAIIRDLSGRTAADAFASIKPKASISDFLKAKKP